MSMAGGIRATGSHSGMLYVNMERNKLSSRAKRTTATTAASEVAVLAEKTQHLSPAPAPTQHRLG
jgi:hypothetical protein